MKWISEDEFVNNHLLYHSHNPEWIKRLQSEYGSSSPVNFAKATAYDSEGNEIITPKCKKCDLFMNQLIGKESFLLALPLLWRPMNENYIIVMWVAMFICWIGGLAYILKRKE